MPVFENHTGINLTDSKLQIVELSHKENSFCLENVDQSIFKERIVPEIEESKLIAILQESFDKINSKKPLQTKFVSFTLPNNYFNIFEIPYEDSLTRKDLLQHFKWELSVLFPQEDSDNYFIQHIEVNKTSIRQENKTIVFALRKDIVKAIHNFCKTNVLELKYVDNAHLASNAFLYIDKNEIVNKSVLSLYVDQNYSSFTAIEGVNPFYFKVMNTEGSNFFDQIDLIIKKLNELKLDFALVKETILCGQNISKDFETRVGEKFGTPIRKVNPFERLHVTDELKNNPLYKSQFNSFTAATGIAIRII